MNNPSTPAPHDDETAPTNRTDEPADLDDDGSGAERPATRVWTYAGRDVVRRAYQASAPSHGDYDEQDVRTRINTQIDQLTWQSPFEPLPYSLALVLREIRPHLPATVTAVALNGTFDAPDGPDTATYTLFAVEGIHGVGGRGRQRLYFLDLGSAALLMAVDVGVPHPALPNQKPDTDAPVPHTHQPTPTTGA